MPKIELYKLFNKSGYTLFSPRHPFFAEERFAQYLRAFRGEETEIILHVEDKGKESFLTRLPPEFLTVEETSSGYAITPRKSAREVQEYLKNVFFDTLRKDDALLLEVQRHQDLFYHYGRFRFRGFYSILHRLFPILFIMHGIPGFQPMAWDMIIGDPYFEDRNFLEISRHYQQVSWGLESAFEDVTLRVVENHALRLLNDVVRQDRNGEGFVQAFRLAARLGLGFLKDFFWPATQATEKSEWTKFLRPPVPLAPWSDSQ
jgi:hypothetical protein|uniref:Uncharacterized protein n=1 Tax=Candidatus Caldatribacterium californiense TaxID=1454726 RepID=A0A7V3YH67_9BACT